MSGPSAIGWHSLPLHRDAIGQTSCAHLRQLATKATHTDDGSPVRARYRRRLGFANRNTPLPDRGLRIYPKWPRRLTKWQLGLVCPRAGHVEFRAESKLGHAHMA